MNIWFILLIVYITPVSLLLAYFVHEQSKFKWIKVVHYERAFIWPWLIIGPFYYRLFYKKWPWDMEGNK